MSEACFFNASRFLRSRPVCLLLLLCAEIHKCQNVKKRDPYGRIRSRHLWDEHDFPKRHVLGVSTELTVSRACEAETSGWECRTQRRPGWAGVEEQREGGGATWWEGRQSGGMKKKHQVTVYIPLRSHVAQTQERELCSGAQSTSRCCASAHFENVVKKMNKIESRQN